MSQLSNEGRVVVHTALQNNLNVAAIMLHAYHPAIRTIAEMATITRYPYDERQVKFVGDTLDRHSWSCYGNAQEVAVVLTYAYHNVHPAINFARTRELQVGAKVDLELDDQTYQVKTASYGTGGQLFVSQDDLEGRADMLVYVSARDRKLVMFQRGEFARNMKTHYEVIGPVDRWYNKAGWFVTPDHCVFSVVLDIPPGISVVEYDAMTSTVILTNGVNDEQ